jgi:recombination protein RecA
MEFDILQKRGSWISYKGTQLAQGRDAAKETLKNDSGLYAEIEEAVKAKLAEKGGAASGSSGASSGGEE